MVSGLKEPDCGLLVGLDIYQLNALIVDTFWKETGREGDECVAFELLCDKSEIMKYDGITLQLFWLTPFNVRLKCLSVNQRPFD